MFVEPKRLGCSLQRSDMCWFVLLGHRRNVSTERTFNPYGLVFELSTVLQTFHPLRGGFGSRLTSRTVLPLGVAVEL